MGTLPILLVYCLPGAFMYVTLMINADFREGIFDEPWFVSLMMLGIFLLLWPLVLFAED